MAERKENLLRLLRTKPLRESSNPDPDVAVCFDTPHRLNLDGRRNLDWEERRQMELGPEERKVCWRVKSNGDFTVDPRYYATHQEVDVPDEELTPEQHAAMTAAKERPYYGYWKRPTKVVELPREEWTEHELQPNDRRPMWNDHTQVFHPTEILF